MSSYSLVTSSGAQQRHSSESDHDSVLDGVLCDTCMDIVILMSHTALGIAERFQSQHHSAVAASTCVQSSSLPRSNSVDSNHAKKTCGEELTGVEVELNVPEKEAGSRHAEILMTPDDQHHLRFRYYYNEIVVVVLWLLSVACCMSYVLCRRCLVRVLTTTLLFLSCLIPRMTLALATSNCSRTTPTRHYKLCDYVFAIVSVDRFLYVLTVLAVN